MQAGADTTLIAASRRGDADAFAQIIERYQRAVYAVAYSGVRDRALADDVAQDTFVVAWRRLGELRDDQRIAAWLCGIARNRARDARKRMQREIGRDMEELVHPRTPFDDMSDAELERTIAEALARVPEVYREPLVLFYYEERSVEDVARALGISAATTNKRLSRGRRYLADGVAAVERGLVRRGPSPTLAASVLAVIATGVVAAPAHASPVKGTTMHKLAIAAAVTAAFGGAGVLLVDTKHTDAHPTTHVATPAPASAPTTRVAASPPATTPNLFALIHGAAPPALPPSATPSGAAADGANDCATVGRHLAELATDTEHGPTDRPDPEACAQCAARYASHCESERWSVERRNCTLAAADIINAHLCAAGSPPAQPPAAIPAKLACSALAPRFAAIAQAAGMHAGVGDLGDQIAAACEAGNWSLALRTCLATGTTMETLQVCMTPN